MLVVTIIMGICLCFIVAEIQTLSPCLHYRSWASWGEEGGSGGARTGRGAAPTFERLWQKESLLEERPEDGIKRTKNTSRFQAVKKNRGKRINWKVYWAEVGEEAGRQLWEKVTTEPS